MKTAVDQPPEPIAVGAVSPAAAVPAEVSGVFLLTA
jgi:hypothetical protein